MLFYCFWRSIDTSCHKHFVDTSCDQQTPPLTTNNKCHSLSWSGATVLITPTSRSIDNTMKPDTGFGGNHIFASHLHSMPPFGGLLLEYCHNVWYGKTRMVWLPDGKKIWRYDDSFWQNSGTWQTDGQTDTAWQHRPRFHSIVRQKLWNRFSGVLILKCLENLSNFKFGLSLWNSSSGTI